MTFSILDAIGNTPLVEIRHLNPNPNVKILAKLEYLNPGGSIKDRAAVYMIENGEKSGKLTPDKTVIEATSGNTGNPSDTRAFKHRRCHRRGLSTGPGKPRHLFYGRSVQ